MYPSGLPNPSSPAALTSSPWMVASMAAKSSQTCPAWGGLSSRASSLVRKTTPSTHSIR